MSQHGKRTPVGMLSDVAWKLPRLLRPARCFHFAAAALAVAALPLVAAAIPLAAGALPLAAQQADDPNPHSDLELVAEVAAVQPGQPFTVALRMTMDEGWHTYWINAGDSGFPLVIDWQLPDGFSAGPLQWPTPERIPVPPLMSFGYEDELFLLAEITPPAALAPGTTVRLAGQADWLVCADVCIPDQGSVALELPVRAGAPADGPFASSIRETRARVAAPAADWAVRAWSTDEGYVVELAPPGGTDALPAPYIFLDSMLVVEHAMAQRVVAASGAVRVGMPRSAFALGEPARLSGIVVGDAEAEHEGGWRFDVPLLAEAPLDVADADPFQVAGALETGGIPAGMAAAFGGDVGQEVTAGVAGAAGGLGLLLALLFAFAGGVILNLMPCVFPVLGVKVLGFVEQAGQDTARARNHGLIFGAGVVVAFWVLAGLLLALRAGGESLGWGFQLQSPTIVALLAMLLFGLGLSLSGVFDIGLGLTRLGAAGAGRGYGDSFLTGGLAVLVATPCTAPFMGAALGFALVQPPLVGMAVFTALALGLAAPYVVLASAPGLLRRLPRPGAWMETFKQVLAFPLYATVVWLVWVFGQQVGMNAVAVLLLGMTLLAFAAWLAGRAGTGRTGMARVAALVLALAAAGVSIWGARALSAPPLAAATVGDWEPWSEARVAELRAEGRPVFVDFTAAWCLSCQVNERVALNSDAARRAFADANVALVKADWTSRNEEIGAALEGFGRNGVPLYVLYPADPAGAPEILPALLSPGIVVRAVERAAARVAAGD
ncbi:MAG: thioredoxin family protein [Gemmatimonadota bacterium]